MFLRSMCPNQCYFGVPSGRNVMKSMVIVIAFGLLVSIENTYAGQSSSVVASHSKTSIVSTSGDINVLVEIRTHEVYIGKASDPRPTIFHSSCTYSKIPCSVVDELTIMVGKTPLVVPRSAFCDLADLNNAEIDITASKSVLTLYGGDASESYIAKIEFNAEEVVRRSLTSAIEPSQPLEETTYHSVVVGD